MDGGLPDRERTKAGSSSMKVKRFASYHQLQRSSATRSSASGKHGSKRTMSEVENGDQSTVKMVRVLKYLSMTQSTHASLREATGLKATR